MVGAHEDAAANDFLLQPGGSQRSRTTSGQGDWARDHVGPTAMQHRSDVVDVRIHKIDKEATGSWCPKTKTDK